MGILNDNMICEEIIRMLFKTDMMLDLSSDGNIMWCDYNKRFLYTDGVDNYIYLGDISIKFNNNYLEIMYGEYFKISLRFLFYHYTPKYPFCKERLQIRHLQNIMYRGVCCV